MKTRISQLVAVLFFAFILVAGNVNATEHKTGASSHDDNIEAALKFEKWMIDEGVWNTSDIRFTVAQETNLEIESWMTSEWVWDVQADKLNLENWMIDENVWKIKPLTFTTVTEQDLAIENWMMNENIWER